MQVPDFSKYATPELVASFERLLERAKRRQMTEEEIREQRVSFVFSCLGRSNKMTKDQVREYIDRIEGRKYARPMLSRGRA